MIFSPKLILFSLLVILYLLIGLGNHNEDNFLSNGLAQKDGTESPTLDDSFSVIGTINSLVITVPETEFDITNAFKVILTGEWNLSVRKGTLTNFEVDFLASPMDGLTPHIHQITNFRPYDNQDSIRLTEDESIMIDGIVDIKIHGIVIWEDADMSISISKGNVFSLDSDDEDTENHFGDQFVYGIVTRLI